MGTRAQKLLQRIPSAGKFRGTTSGSILWSITQSPQLAVVSVPLTSPAMAFSFLQCQLGTDEQQPGRNFCFILLEQGAGLLPQCLPLESAQHLQLAASCSGSSNSCSRLLFRMAKASFCPVHLNQQCLLMTLCLCSWMVPGRKGLWNLSLQAKAQPAGLLKQRAVSKSSLCCLSPLATKSCWEQLGRAMYQELKSLSSLCSAHIATSLPASQAQSLFHLPLFLHRTFVICQEITNFCPIHHSLLFPGRTLPAAWGG